MSSKHQSSKNQSTDWTDWEWNAERKQWGRWRMRRGKYETQWQDPETATHSTSTGKESEGQTTEWTEWELDEADSRWGRWRMVKGEYETEWRDTGTATSLTSKGKEPEEIAKEATSNLSVILYRPKWGNLHHWALHFGAGDHVYQVNGEAMNFTAAHILMSFQPILAHG